MKDPQTIIHTLLARREYSAHQLEQKLIKKGFDLHEIQNLIAALSQKRIINDHRYTEAYINDRKRQGMGPLKIKQELKNHGIAKEVIEEQLDITDNAWFDEITNVWRKYFQKKMVISELDWEQKQKQKQKEIRFFLQRGFTQEHINHIYKLDEHNE